MDKINLRNRAKGIRKTLDIGNISINLANQIRESDIFKYSKNVMLYYPSKYEINLLSLIDNNKNFYLPVVQGEYLEVFRYKKGDKLQQSKFGIYEPLTEAVSSNTPDLIIVPALMCDKQGYRLGYGGGYYDRFLKTVKSKTICAIPKELYIDQLPHNEYDVKVQNIFIN